MKSQTTEEVKSILLDSVNLKKKVASEMADEIAKTAEMIADAVRDNGKVVVFGNGGSAADAAHMQAELTHQFEIKNRRAIPCIALTCNSSVMTAIGNDWSFDKIFERQVEGFVKAEDVVIGISTSGNSANVLKGLEEARRCKAKTIGLLGGDGGKIKDVCDECLIVPSNITARIQEVHITIIHIICKIVERKLYG